MWSVSSACLRRRIKHNCSTSWTSMTSINLATKTLYDLTQKNNYFLLSDKLVCKKLFLLSDVFRYEKLLSSSDKFKAVLVITYVEEVLIHLLLGHSFIFARSLASAFTSALTGSLTGSFASAFTGGGFKHADVLCVGIILLGERDFLIFVLIWFLIHWLVKILLTALSSLTLNFGSRNRLIKNQLLEIIKKFKLLLVIVS